MVNIYQLRLLQTDPIGRVIPAGGTQYYLRRPIVWVQGKRVTSGYLRHVFHVFDRIGYAAVTDETQEFDVMWAHDYPFVTYKSMLTKLQAHQRVNHFPGSGYLTNKVNLVTSPTQLSFIPRAFKLPQDKDKLLEYAQQNPDKMWVQKSNNHRGVHIKTMSEMELDKENTFIQMYVDRPYLIDGRRFDIGLYTTVTSVDPLRVYTYEGDWLVRFCPDEYYPFDKNNINSYVITDDYMPPWKVESLKRYYDDLGFNRKESLFAYLKANGKDPLLLDQRLKEAVRTALLMKEPALIQSGSNYRSTRNFFEMVRFDFVLDEDLNVYLMEVNMSPNLSSGHFPANSVLYEQVIFSMLSLVGVARSVSDDIKKWTPSERDMQVASKDVHVYSDKCASEECKDSCRTLLCKMCKDCLKAEQVESLHRAYLEHQNRKVWRRVYPTPFRSQEAAQAWRHQVDKAFLDDRPANQWMALWFHGKCLQDATWCM